MKTKVKRKALAILISMTMAFTMMPIMGAPVYADDPAPDAPGIALGPDVLSIGSNTSGAATVHMAGTKWCVIGYKGGGVASTKKNPQVPGSADTMTLIADNILKTGVQFNPSSNQVNTYKDSNLYNEVNALTDDTNGLFSKGEKEGIVSRDLAKGDYTDQEPYTNGIAGDNVTGALLWPLSTQEAYYMDSELRRATYHWWLRSPGDTDTYAALVHLDGSLYCDGDRVDGHIDAVRPAFNFNLESVIFTSAAAGGKSAGEGKLSEVGTNDLGEWKLTVKDEAHENFKLERFFFDVSDKNLMRIKFSGALDATAEKKEYISAIILSKDNKVKYYGKITPAASGDNQECILKLDDKMAGGDTLYVFNEQCNKDAVLESGSKKEPAKTDYASELKKVFTAPEVSITTQPQNKKLTYGDTTGNTLEVAAEAEEGCTLSYQWYRKDSENAEPVSLKNETNASYTVPADQNVGTTKYYYCKVRATRTDGTWATETSNQAAVTVDKAKLTVRPKDQTFTYNGQLQGPADVVYTGTEVDEYIAYDKSSLKFNDELNNITVDGQGKDVGEYPLTITGCMINANGGKGDDVTDNYDITYEDGILHITKKPDPKPTSKVSGTPLVRMTTKGDNSLVVSWNKIQGADGYDIYFTYCGETSKYAATVKGNKTFSWTKSGLKKGRCYKAYVKAYVMRNGKKTFVKCSPLVHAYASGGSNEYTSAKAITVEKASASLKAGQAFQIRPSIVKLQENKYLMPKKFAPTFRYMSSDERVATVSSGGKVTAKGKGTCNIYVYAHNGISRQVKITVK